MTGNTTDQSEFYEYEPLDYARQQIRLVKIKRNENGPIHCELRTFDSDHCPQYEALSYTWGPPTPTCRILVDNKILRIRQNLHLFLRQFRIQRLESNEDEMESPEYLWIDQISIDQSRTRERNNQVGHMSTIYGQSARVIIWLPIINEANDTPLVSAARSLDNFENQPVLHQAILHNEYFSRLWIVQEVVLARSIRVLIHGCPNASISWEEFSQPHLWLPYTNHDEPRTGNNYYSLVNLTDARHTQTQPLHKRLENFSDHACEDPRDKVYGLMGIVDERDHVPIDYAKPLVDVYVDVLRICYKRSRIGAYNVAFRLGKLWQFDRTTLGLLLGTLFRPAVTERDLIAFGCEYREEKIHRDGKMIGDERMEKKMMSQEVRWWFEYGDEDGDLEDEERVKRVYPDGGAWNELYEQDPDKLWKGGSRVI